MIGIYNSPSTLICTDLAIGWQTGFDLTVDVRPIGESKDNRRTVNARNVNLADPMFRLLSVRISSGNGEQRPPALSRMFPGDEFQLVLPRGAELSDMIAVGGTARTLIRTPFAGSVKVMDLKGNPVAFTLAGKVVTLEVPAATPVRIYFLPVLDLFVGDPFSLSAQVNRAAVGWEIYSEEIGGEE